MSGAPRQLPALEPESAFFWTSGADGRLRIARCNACRRYQHPPLPLCPRCGGELEPQAVSGRGRVATFTVNRQAWLPDMAVPFVFAAVELAEQPQLYVFSNIVGCAPEAVRRGMAVEVRFEAQADVFLPLFQPLEQDAGLNAPSVAFGDSSPASGGASWRSDPPPRTGGGGSREAGDGEGVSQRRVPRGGLDAG